MRQAVRAIVKKDSKYLLIKEVKSEYYNFWHFPGGKIDEGENKEEAIQRELYEELNLKIISTKFIHEKICHYQDGGAWNIVSFLCDVEDISILKIMENSKCDGYCWLPLCEIREIKRLGIDDDVLCALEAM